MKKISNLFQFSYYMIICSHFCIINSSIVTTEHIIKDTTTIGEQNTENPEHKLLHQIDFKTGEKMDQNISSKDNNTLSESNNKESLLNMRSPMTEKILKHKVALFPAKCLLGYHSNTEEVELKSMDPNHDKIKFQDSNDEHKSHPIYKSESSFVSIAQPSSTQIGSAIPTTLTFITKMSEENSQQILEKNVQTLHKIVNTSNVGLNNTILKQSTSIDTTKLPTVNNVLYSYRRFGTKDDIKYFETSTTKIPELTTQSEQFYDIDEQSEPLYEQRMKFVIPYPLKVSTGISNYPWEIDQYAYYPSHLRPAYMNIPVPYLPTYHLIKTLTIPNDTA